MMECVLAAGGESLSPIGDVFTTALTTALKTCAAGLSAPIFDEIPRLGSHSPAGNSFGESGPDAPRAALVAALLDSVPVAPDVTLGHLDSDIAAVPLPSQWDDPPLHRREKERD